MPESTLRSKMPATDVARCCAVIAPLILAAPASCRTFRCAASAFMFDSASAAFDFSCSSMTSSF